jgi:uncharacterized protein YbjT (DUF2867 family)
MTMPTYAVTGAFGHLGRLAVQELLARGVPASDVVAVVRTRGKAADLAGRGGPAFDLPELARIITEVTGAKVTYRDLPAGEYASWLQRTGLDEATAHFVAGLDASIARGDLETSSQDLAQLLGRPATSLTDVVGAAHDAVPNAARDSREH